jgi:hypothetical protein
MLIVQSSSKKATFEAAEAALDKPPVERGNSAEAWLGIKYVPTAPSNFVTQFLTSQDLSNQGICIGDRK